MKNRLFAYLITGAVVFTAIACGESPAPVPGQLTSASLADYIQSGQSDIFTLPFDRYDGELKELPIGVFDSGIGGLTVLEEILKVDSFDNVSHASGADGIPDFENERFIYLGDQANMPYGNYPSENKVDFLRELILKDASFLLGNRYWQSQDADAPSFDKPQVKAIVIACNTATAYGYEDIKQAFSDWNIPVFLVGVVDAGAKGAIAALKEGNPDGAVAVMATVGTCNSDGYPRAIGREAGYASLNNPEVTQQGSLGLAGAIEGDNSFVIETANVRSVEYRGPSTENVNAIIDAALKNSYQFEADGLLGESSDPASWRLNSVENYIRYDTAMLVDSHSKKDGAAPISAVILGCTHFPFHQERIAASFKRLRELRLPDGSEPYKNAVAETVAFIDPSTITAEQLFEALDESDSLLTGNESRVIDVDEFYISVPNPLNTAAEIQDNGGFAYDYKYGRDTGDFVTEYVKRVPMSAKNLSASNIESIRSGMPEVWKRLVTFTSESPRSEGLADGAKLK